MLILQIRGQLRDVNTQKLRAQSCPRNQNTGFASKVICWFKTDATCEAMLKFLSNLSKFICAQIHFVTTQLAILHNYINLYAQTELVAGSKKEKKK